MPAIGTANLLEIVWTLIGLIGLIYCLRNRRENQLDLIAVRADKTLSALDCEIQLLITNASIRRESISAFLQLVFIYVGARAMLLPDNAATQSGLDYLAVGVLFIGAEVATTYCSIHERNTRQTFNRLVRQEQKEDTHDADSADPARVS